MSNNFSIDKYFKESSPVEISSNVDYGSWYLGTIIKLYKSTSEALVQYQTLFDDDQPVVEKVDCSHLRPIQPPDHDGHKFKLDDQVDAYFRKGWWEGIITQVVDGGSQYVVFFRCSHEQRPFKPARLRFHREWVYGKWHPELGMVLGARMDVVDQEEHPSSPDMEMQEAASSRESQELPSSCALNQVPGAMQKTPLPTAAKRENEQNKFDFNPGQFVEVYADGKGYGVWFQAIVIENCNDGWFQVKYDNLVDDDGETSLTEKVHGQLTRPRPPTILEVDRFAKSEKVEALYEGDWWEGVISSVLINDRYKVCFKGTGCEEPFRHSELRVCQEWKNGKWVLPSTKARKL